jgi:hypothetical protein
MVSKAAIGCLLILLPSSPRRKEKNIRPSQRVICTTKAQRHRGTKEHKGWWLMVGVLLRYLSFYIPLATLVTNKPI